MEFDFELTPKSSTVLNLKLDRGQLMYLEAQILEMLNTDHDHFNFSLVGRFRTAVDFANPYDPDLLGLESKTRRMLELIEQNPGIGRGRLMQRLALRAALFDHHTSLLEARGLVVVVETEARGRGRKANRFFGTRGAVGDQLRLMLEEEPNSALEAPSSGSGPLERTRAREILSQIGPLAEALDPDEFSDLVATLEDCDLEPDASLQIFKLRTQEGTEFWRVMANEVVVWETEVVEDRKIEGETNV